MNKNYLFSLLIGVLCLTGCEDELTNDMAANSARAYFHALYAKDPKLFRKTAYNVESDVVTSYFDYCVRQLEVIRRLREVYGTFAVTEYTQAVLRFNKTRPKETRVGLFLMDLPNQDVDILADAKIMKMSKSKTVITCLSNEIELVVTNLNGKSYVLVGTGFKQDDFKSIIAKQLEELKALLTVLDENRRLSIDDLLIAAFR